MIESKENSVVLRDASQLSAPAAESLGPALGSRRHLFPILESDAVRAVLYAEAPPESLDLTALELLASL